MRKSPQWGVYDVPNTKDAPKIAPGERCGGKVKRKKKTGSKGNKKKRGVKWKCR